MLLFNLFKSRDGMFRWNIEETQNGKIIADSAEGYVNKSDCLHGLRLVASTNANTPLKDHTV